MGVWGAPATYVNARNERWVYFPMWGPPSKSAGFARTNGDAADGSIMAFQVVMQNDKPVLVPKWVSRNFAVPDSPVIANGVLYAISPARTRCSVTRIRDTTPSTRSQASAAAQDRDDDG